MYITALNSDNLPDINTSWKIVIDSQLKSAYDTGLDYYTNQMNNLDYKNYYTSDKLYKKHYELREKALSYILDFSNMNIPTNTFMETFQKLERKINDEYINTYIPQWNEVCKTQCEDIYTKLIEVYKNNSELNEIFACLNTIEEVLKFIEQCDTNEKKYEVIYPKIISFFVDFLKKEFNEKKKMNEEKINELQQEVILSQELLEKQKKILEETREAYENQIKEIKEENLENRIDLEAKIDEKSKILQNMKTANENTIEEMKLKIDELNSAIIKYQNQEQEYNNNKDKKKKKKMWLGLMKL
jgi:DNA repair exonuclease SbcCD ATPase subunit